MPFLTAAVAVVGALCVFDLVLSLGVVRRLREHSEQLAGVLADRPDAAALPPAGKRIGDFVAASTTGAVVSRDRLSGTTLVGFFSSTCPACVEQLPQFVAYAAGCSGPVVAVAIGSARQTQELVQALSPVATVVIDDLDGPVAAACGVRGFPVVLLVDSAGTILHSSVQVAALPAYA